MKHEGVLVADLPFLSPTRLARALITYLWWVELSLRTGCHCGSLASHLSYFRREHARFAHRAGYADDWRAVLAQHRRCPECLGWLRAATYHTKPQPGTAPNPSALAGREEKRT